MFRPVLEDLTVNYFDSKFIYLNWFHDLLSFYFSFIPLPHFPVLVMLML